MVGAQAARSWHNISDISDLFEMSVEDLQKIETIGPAMAQSIRMYFDREENITLVKRLASLDVNTKGISAPKEGKFSEKVFVLTGTLDHYTRDKAKEEIEARGGKVTNSE